MKRAALLAVCALLAVGVTTGQVRGQTATAPSAPTISSVTAAAYTLTVAWTAPSDTGDEPLSSYDLRYILSDATDKADANWTSIDSPGSDTLQHTLTGLRDSTGYDVQVRAVSDIGPGAWSDTSTQTTLDHGDTDSGATVVTLDSSIEARIDSGDDKDVFKLEVSGQVDLWIYTVGDVDTLGELTGPNVQRKKDDAGYPFGLLNFGIRQQLEAGTYYITVSSVDEEHTVGKTTGPYTLEIRTASAPATTLAEAETAIAITSGEPAPGRIATGGDFNYFKFVLASANDVWIAAPSSDSLDTVGTLLDSDGEEVVENDDSDIRFMRTGFSIRRELAAGTYYVKVRAFSSNATGVYALFFEEVPDNSSAATARPISLYSLAAGRVDTGTPDNYFSLTVDRDTWLLLLGHWDFSESLTASITDDQGAAVIGYPPSSGGVKAFLSPGTYSVWMSARGDGGAYVLQPLISTSDQGLHDRCKAVASPIRDPLAGCQWHLHNTGTLRPGGANQDINVLEVWDDTKGSGVNVAVVDNGMNHTHPDLNPNVVHERNHDYHDTNTFSDIFRPGRSAHGTKVAGLIAALDNDEGMRGVAPQANIYGYNLLLQESGIQFYEADAMTRNMDDTAVSNNSWGSGDTGRPSTVAQTWELAIANGITNGYGGKGTVYVWAGGNGGLHDNSNLDEYGNHYGVIAVCAITHGDVRTWYSERGANLWVCAPGGDPALGIATTDRGSYTVSFAGTSASTPIVSGVVALMRATNPDLSWRDVKLILAASARKNSATDSGWEQGALRYGSTADYYQFNHKYGFGAVDAGAAVDLADGWSTVPAWRSVTAASSDVDLELPTTASSVSSQVTIEGGHVEFVEFVAVNIDIVHSSFRNLEFELVSPSGAVSKLTTCPTGSDRMATCLAGGSTLVFRPLQEPFRFGSARHLGENPTGQWTLRINDYRGGAWGKLLDDPPLLKSWRITVYGHGYAPGRPTITSFASAATSLTVNWSAPDDTGASAITGYDLRYIRSDAADRSSSNWTTKGDIWSSGALNYALTGLTGGVKYLIQMRASNAEGVGGWSTAFSMSTSASMPPDAPTIDSVTARSAEFTVVWQAPTTGSSGITSYDVRYIKTSEDETDDTNWTVQTGAWRAGGGDLQYTVTGLDNDVEYDVQVRAVNSAGTGSWSATSVVRPLRANADPEFPASESGSRTVPESAAAGTSVGAPVAATDGDGDDLVYTLSGGGGVFSIEGATGQVKTEAALDYETRSSYSVSVTASDMKDANGEADTASDDTIMLALTVGDVNEAPVVTGETSIDYEENGTATVSYYSDNDPDDGDAITWTLQGADFGDFEISPAGVLMFSESPDRESPKDANRNNEYLVTVKASDDDGLSDTLAVKVTVTDVDEPPSLEGAVTVDYGEGGTGDVAGYSATDPEGATIGWTLEGDDAGDFEISDSGVLTFKVDAPDHEHPEDANGDNDYLVTVVASDGNTRNDQTLNVRVTVGNRDEAGTVTLSSLQPQAGTALAATLTDPDGSLSGQAWQWAVSSNRSTWADIDGETAASHTPGAGDVGKYLRVTVSYSDGHGAGKSLVVTLTDAVQAAPVAENNPPAFPATENGERSVAENTPAGRSIGSPVAAGDPDQDSLTYTLDTTGAAVFDINANTGQLLTKAPLDHEQGDEHEVTVTATDPAGGFDTVGVTIAVEDVNEAPAVTGQTAISHIENDPGEVATYSASDPDDGDALSWALGGTDASDFEISAEGVLTFREPPDHEARADDDRNNEYLVTVKAADDDGLSGTLDVKVTVTNVNEPHSLEGEDTVDYEEGGTGDVANYSATDPEGATIGWSLSGADAGAFEISSSGVLTFRETPDHEHPKDANGDNNYLVTVVASDGNTRNDQTLNVRVTVGNRDEAGTVTLSSLQPQAGTALAATLTDPDGSLSGQAWQWAVSSNRSTWADIDGETAASYTPGAGDVGKYLRVTVSYSDGHGAGKSLVVTLTDAVQAAPVAENNPPAFPATENGERSVAENTPAGRSIGSPVAAGDPDQDSLTYTLDTTGAAVFDINANTGQLLTKAPLDHEQGDEHEVTVTATDPAGGFDTVGVTIAVEDVNEAPAVTGQTAISHIENDPGEVATYSASDPDDGDALSWALGGTDASDFEISAEGVLTFREPPDHEARADDDRNNEYLVTVKAADDDGLSGTLDVKVTVTNVNEPHSLEGEDTVDYEEGGTGDVANYSATDPEGATIGWSLSGADAGAFEISSSGVLTFRETPDHEDPKDANGDNNYLVTVVASDGNTRNDQTLNVRVTVGNRDEAGTVTLSSLQPQAGTALAATLTDPDGSLSGQAWQWAVSSNRSTWADIDGETAASYTPGAGDVGKYLRVTVSYSDGHGAGKSLVVMLTDAVQAAPVAENNPPAFPATENGERSVAENTPAGRSIGSPVAAGDPDQDSLTYTLDTTGAAVFDINANTGQLLTKAPLDHEQGDEHEVTVTATDPAGGFDTVGVTITVEDVNEAPAVTGRTAVSHGENDREVATYSADDPDSDAVTWSLGGTDAGDFEINAGGVLTFREPPDREAPADANRNNEYLVTVRATDDDDDRPLSGSLNVAVTVGDVDEMPELTGETSIDYAENGTGAVATYSARDPEGEEISWSLAGTDAGAFEGSDGGVLTFREAPDHEQPVDANGNNEYVVTVVASDGNPLLDARLPVKVTVKDVNEPVTLTGGPATPAVPEHAGTSVATYVAFDPEGARLGWSLAGRDAGDFQISDGGVLSFRVEPDYEARSVYSLSVSVSDGVTANTATQNVTVTVENVEEAGTVTVSPLQPQADTELTASLTDPDGVLSVVIWQWQSSGDQTNWSPIPGATGPTYTPVDGDVDNYLLVTVSYSDGHGSGKTAVGELPNRVRAAPVKPNEPPAFPDYEDGQRSVRENTRPGQPIGSPLEADDPDPDDVPYLSYTLDDAGAEVFGIDGDSGQLRTKAPLDTELKPEHFVTVTVSDPSDESDALRVTIAVDDENEPPLIAGPTVLLVPEQSTGAVARYLALDPEQVPVTWDVSGPDGDDFEISAGGDLRFDPPPELDAPADVNEDNVYEVTVEAADELHTVRLDVTVTVAGAEQAPSPSPGGRGAVGGGGGGGPSGPSPSIVDFEWTVKHDIEALDSGHDSPTGAWSDRTTLWVLENGDGADDAVYAYDLKSGERVEEREFELDEANRAPRGVWSDGGVLWVSDSGRNKLFAHDLESGERLPEHDIALAERNRDARAIWSDGETMWVLDRGKDGLFAYDLASGELLAEYELDDANDDPHGVWSDRVTVWVSNHNPKRLFAYRLPVLPPGEEAPADTQELERVRGEEFGELSKASNNSPRGIWSDGEVMYVADASDARVYSYNMPDAIDARLASLTLSGIEIGEFSPDSREYEGVATEDLAETTVEAAPVQSGTKVEIHPLDADGDGDETNGYQVALKGVDEVTVTVTSADGSRMRVYVVRFGEAPSAACLRGDVAEGFSLVIYEGGSVEELEDCAQGRHVTALYTTHDGVFVPDILGAPAFVNRSFRELYAGGVPPITLLLAKSDGPATAEPGSSSPPGGGAPRPWPECLRGATSTGFSLVLYEGGSVEGLESCAQGLGVTALYALDDGVFVPHILGAPAFVNRDFEELFADGLPAATPLLARSGGPPEAGSGQGRETGN